MAKTKRAIRQLLTVPGPVLIASPAPVNWVGRHAWTIVLVLSVVAPQVPPGSVRANTLKFHGFVRNSFYKSPAPNCPIKMIMRLFNIQVNNVFVL